MLQLTIDDAAACSVSYSLAFMNCLNLIKKTARCTKVEFSPMNVYEPSCLSEEHLSLLLYIIAKK